MCAIFGVIGEYDQQKAESSFSKMLHRGPDESNIIQTKDFFFAHQLLKIQNTSNKQPFKFKNILISFNGEIYNYKELSDELNSFGYTTQDEIEVLASAYERWGVEFVHKLRGMFAIAIKDEDSLYLFRDRLGKKPLFYLDGESFVFASEIKALVPYLKKNEMDNDALLSYLSFLAPTPPYTFFKSIKKLGGGEYLIYKNNKISIKKYFNILDQKSNLITDKDEALHLLESKLKESIEIRLQSDQQMAGLLSGGIDSATLNYFSSKYGHNLQTYTLGYKGYEKYDESLDAKESAKLLGLENKRVEVSLDDYNSSVEDILSSLDEPLNDPAAIPLNLLFKEIKKDGIRVVLSGEGSDELFLGYRHYFNYLDVEQMKNLKNKNWLKRYFKNNYDENREWEWYKRVLNDSVLFRTSGEKFTDLQKNNLLRQNIVDDQALKYIKSYRDMFENSTHTDEANWYSYIDLVLFQAEHFLSKLDRVSMAHSIESRTPFLDHELVSLVFSIDPKLKYEDGITKSLLKQIMKPHINKEILKRKKKGFSNPYIEYLIESKKISLIQEVNKQTHLFKELELKELLSAAKSGAFKHHIWGLYVLSVWIKKNLL
ncbi:asparagine synthase (glutamine-hydrolyzing) [Sulfurimonas sp.]|uniref:asparagine synthase (glutamine-hydrolyzing) n=1 Tax=Sulfurimonas sp. TaxID=2022749 RepID=UPI003569D071